MKLKEAMEGILAERNSKLHPMFEREIEFNDLTNEELIDLISETVGELKPTRGLGVKEEEE